LILAVVELCSLSIESDLQLADPSLAICFGFGGRLKVLPQCEYAEYQRCQYRCQDELEDAVPLSLSAYLVEYLIGLFLDAHNYSSVVGSTGGSGKG